MNTIHTKFDDLYEEEVKCSKNLQDCVTLLDIGELQQFYKRLTKGKQLNINYDIGSSDYCGRKAYMLCGSAEEGGLTARFFGENEDKICVELDVMMHLGTILSEQLIPCTRPGFYKLKGEVNIMTAIPKAFQEINSFVWYVKWASLKCYSPRDYLSATLIKLFIDKKTRMIRDSSRCFDELFSVICGIDRDEYQTTPTVHGPAVMWTLLPDISNSFINSIQIDGVISLSVNGWPNLAMEWISRDRIWPPQKYVEEIICDGYLLVAKNPDWNHARESAACDAEEDAHWRLSFSLAERRLAQVRSPKQNYCYFIFKSIFYFKFAEFLRSKHISSYLAKTTFMWMCEELDFNAFEPTEVINKLFVLFKQYLRARLLPHYFIREINLIENLSCCPHIIDSIETIAETQNDLQLTRKLTSVLKNTKLLTSSTRRMIWKFLCKNIMHQTTFLDYLPKAERFLKLSTDERVIGFCQLFTYCLLTANLDKL